MATEPVHLDRTARIEDRQADGLDRVAALERLAELSEKRLTEERRANQEERRANQEERRANQVERRVAWSIYAILVIALVGSITSLIFTVITVVK